MRIKAQRRYKRSIDDYNIKQERLRARGRELKIEDERVYGDLLGGESVEGGRGRK